VVVVHPTWQRTRPGVEGDEHCGWAFANESGEPFSSPSGHGSFSNEGSMTDPLNGAKFVRDLYELANAPATQRYTVPILWDGKLKTIVNNESSVLIRELNSSFNNIAKNPGMDLYPEPLRPAIDAVNEWVYSGINNGVYKCGFAISQEAYDGAVAELFDALDRVEEILSKQRYIAGDVFTEADVRLFQTLIRFDEVYVVYFKTNRKCIREYKHMSEYVKEVYQMPGMGETVDMNHIKVHYFTSHPTLNTHAIIPSGPGTDFSAPHNRAELFPIKA